ncbi:MAG: hypothetical protein F6K08_11455 [Okeania sp. SIO1H6]|nr:hypothetical protein [Okeania sp. SIO1H6]
MARLIDFSLELQLGFYYGTKPLNLLSGKVQILEFILIVGEIKSGL